jgi:hypothetical protein
MAEDRDRFCGRCGRENPDPHLAPPDDWLVAGDVDGGDWTLVCPGCLTDTERTEGQGR